MQKMIEKCQRDSPRRPQVASLKVFPVWNLFWFVYVDFVFLWTHIHTQSEAPLSISATLCLTTAYPFSMIISKLCCSIPHPHSESSHTMIALDDCDSYFLVAANRLFLPCRLDSLILYILPILYAFLSNTSFLLLPNFWFVVPRDSYNLCRIVQLKYI